MKRKIEVGLRKKREDRKKWKMKGMIVNWIERGLERGIGMIKNGIVRIGKWEGMRKIELEIIGDNR